MSFEQEKNGIFCIKLTRSPPCGRRSNPPPQTLGEGPCLVQICEVHCQTRSSAETHEGVLPILVVKNKDDHPPRSEVPGQLAVDVSATTETVAKYEEWPLAVLGRRRGCRRSEEWRRRVERRDLEGGGERVE